jgi:hypothetical protein
MFQPIKLHAMKALLIIVTFSVLGFQLGLNQSMAQCYRCSYDLDWNKTNKSAAKVMKQQFPEAGKVDWYKCELGYLFAVEDFGDSTYTYVFSEDKKWLGKETRYIVVSVRPTTGPQL